MSYPAVYRVFDESGDLLYVGCSTQLPTRLAAHSFDKPWWTDVARIAVEHFSSREDALAAEIAAIATEAPRHNVSGGQPVVVAAEVARRRAERERTTVARRAEQLRASTYATHGRVACSNCGYKPDRMPKGRQPAEVSCDACGCRGLARELAASA